MTNSCPQVWTRYRFSCLCNTYMNYSNSGSYLLKSISRTTAWEATVCRVNIWTSNMCDCRNYRRSREHLRVVEKWGIVSLMKSSAVWKDRGPLPRQSALECTVMEVKHNTFCFVSHIPERKCSLLCTLYTTFLDTFASPWTFIHNTSARLPDRA